MFLIYKDVFCFSVRFDGNVVSVEPRTTNKKIERLMPLIAKNLAFLSNYTVCRAPKENKLATLKNYFEKRGWEIQLD